MKRWVWRKAVIIPVLLLVGIGGIMVRLWTNQTEELITARVERGAVTETITVSGIARASEAARLRFSDNGRITDILVSKGDVVTKGQILAKLEGADLDADRREAMAGLSRALASRDELAGGVRKETRDVASTSVSQAQSALLRVKTEEATRVRTLTQALFSDDLELIPEKRDDTNNAPPIVGGSYSCTTPGTYTIEVYRSGAYSGYSYRVSGLESGTYTGYTDVAGAFGTCGLTLLFDEAENYSPIKWTLEIPNKRGRNYLANQNALTLAEERERISVEAAEDTLRAAEVSAALTTANPRDAEVARSTASVEEALARIAKVDALRERRTLRAPFNGTISDVLPHVGETQTATDPVVVMVSNNAFEVMARIPEIDITKVHDGDTVSLVFDAKADTTVRGVVSFVSPLATTIDGVAYFDATISLETVPDWMREGLNADAQIKIEHIEDTPRVPKRFIIKRDGAAFVRMRENGVVVERTVSVVREGSEGYVAVDLPLETEVIAPEHTQK